jgi:hypothetical protein
MLRTSLVPSPQLTIGAAPHCVVVHRPATLPLTARFGQPPPQLHTNAELQGTEARGAYRTTPNLPHRAHCHRASPCQ